MCLLGRRVLGLSLRQWALLRGLLGCGRLHSTRTRTLRLALGHRACMFVPELATGSYCINIRKTAEQEHETLHSCKAGSGDLERHDSEA